jgi:hypothetical protein
LILTVQQGGHHASVVQDQHVRGAEVLAEVAEDAVFDLARVPVQNCQAGVVTLPTPCLGWLLGYEVFGKVELIVRRLLVGF